MIGASLTTDAIRIEDSLASQMRGCGVVDPSIAERLDPALLRLAGSLQAFSELGGAYLAIIGGTAALETTWVEAIEDVDLDDLNPESLWKFRVKGFGPLLVAMDSHGSSLYEDVDRKARARRANTLAKLGVK